MTSDRWIDGKHRNKKARKTSEREMGGIFIREGEEVKRVFI